MNQLNVSFIWNNKYHYIREIDLIKDYKDGGIIDFDVMD